MLESVPVCLLVGTVLGFLSGLGIGGGSLLILWLTLILGVPQATARGINLLFFLPAAVIACCFRWKQGSIPFRKILPAMIAGAISAGAFTLIGKGLDTALLDKAFGLILLATGIREILYKPR